MSEHAKNHGVANNGKAKAKKAQGSNGIHRTWFNELHMQKRIAIAIFLTNMIRQHIKITGQQALRDPSRITSWIGFFNGIMPYQYRETYARNQKRKPNNDTGLFSRRKFSYRTHLAPLSEVAILF